MQAVMGAQLELASSNQSHQKAVKSELKTLSNGNGTARSTVIVRNYTFNINSFAVTRQRPQTGCLRLLSTIFSNCLI